MVFQICSETRAYHVYRLLVWTMPLGSTGYFGFLGVLERDLVPGKHRVLALLESLSFLHLLETENWGLTLSVRFS